MNRIDANDIETLSPISRYRIRERNRTNIDFREKYFNKEFNLLNFALKCV